MTQYTELITRIDKIIEKTAAIPYMQKEIKGLVKLIEGNGHTGLCDQFDEIKNKVKKLEKNVADHLEDVSAVEKEKKTTKTMKDRIRSERRWSVWFLIITQAILLLATLVLGFVNMKN